MYRTAERQTITFTAEMRDDLRAAYKKAVERGKDIFTFEDNEYVVGYAKHLLEYLDAQFGEAR